MEDKLLEIQVCENYTRDVFITIKVNKENAKELSEILNEFKIKKTKGNIR